MLRLLRLLLYIQVLLGLGRFAGVVTNQRLWESHISLGVLAAVLALYALRPRLGLPQTGLRTGARFGPLAALALGLGIYAGVLHSLPFVLLHIVTGFAAVGLVEAAAARERRRVPGREGRDAGAQAGPQRRI